MKRTPKNGKLKKGFAIMSKEDRVRIARMGGKAVCRGTLGKQHMKNIGRSGGLSTGRKYAA